ncbi:3-oxoacyl-ACP reductase [Rhodococcus sp. 15-725-2-2b]|uniref:3-oxoacyl-ACP reductase FabG n=1 Tax=unclassified Rhodococcus (in: high G+C Gram-positive bacteria) TaxID=192944 RepID=UPI000B9B382C|nr:MULTISPECIES: 3-oxoacyl-ACP reductase FabG [unclassified Rhodococcus (in: high G+C Gram-positive bacteria)]OZC63599.1 3-oxoacyl-ACP reductase [Rhodococcus sp. 06-469-3-2]OZD40764.1 3-oxoacyl-ACP reductase [Rhodococcus sp. 06-1477-1A]OZE67128.1 3-oxoacyl-ACP reductase [Rhodococcus sp. 15-725-2-2b]
MKTYGLLQGRAAIITGGAQGIGRAIAERLVAEGAAVVIADLDPSRTSEAAIALGGKTIGVPCDVTSADDIAYVVKRCAEEFGTLDVMVNNAGITRDASMRKMTPADFDAVVSVHLKGSWLGTRAASGAMREHGTGGSIINVSSISGKVGNVGQTNYSAAKAGIVGLTKAAAKEVAHAGVRVNAIAPGMIRTPMTLAMRAEIFDEQERQIPLGRVGEPDEIAKVAAFLASDLASYITGTVVEVSGGRGM